MCTFEQLDRDSNPSVIFRGIAGSRAYGTATPESDTDIRGVFVVPSAEYVRLTPPPRQVSDERNDRTYYSLLRFCELASEANPTALEMLFLPEDCILFEAPAFRILRDNRAAFISRRAVDSHLGYAVSQIKKARGCNKRVWNPWPEEPPAPEDYCVFIADARKLPLPLKDAGIDLARCKAAPVAKSASSDILALYCYDDDVGGVFRGGMPVVSDIPREDAGRRIGIMVFGRQAFESAKRQHRQYWDWRRNRNDARWVRQERGELDYDAKNMMHLVRLLFCGANIVGNGEPIVRFSGPKLDTLLSIRRGEWKFDDIMALAERMQGEILAGRDRLPPDVDKAKIDTLISAVMEEAGVE